MTYLSCVFVLLLVTFLTPHETFASIGLEIKTLFNAGVNGLTSSIKTKTQKLNSVKFFLHSNTKNLEDKNYAHELVYQNPKSVSGAPFNKNCVSKFLIHGFTQSKNAQFPLDVKTAYLTRMRHSLNDTERCWNIVIVDWGAISGGLYFIQALNHVPLVGQRLGEMLAWLLSQGFIDDAKHIHLIGHSLGAHVTGYASETLFKLAHKKPGRITGSDPAGPAFHSDKSSSYGRILKSTDADFVDVYHCNMGAYGINKVIGHADFFPNVETLLNLMPQCNALQGNIRLSTDDPESCSHNMCPRYLAWAILHPTLFEKCDNDKKLLEKKQACTGQMVHFGQDFELIKGSFYGSITVNLDNMETFM